MSNVFYDEVQVNLPRLLSLIDTDRSSVSFGVADRYHWAWGLIDFGNGSLQGMSRGMALLWINGKWPFDTSQETFISRIDSLFVGTKFLTRKNGSLEEAFPNEGSYCVTAIVAYDLVCTVDMLGSYITNEVRQSWLSVIEPLVNYLIKSDEEHALISNHLATSIAALVRWEKVTKEETAIKRAQTLLERLLSNQSEEGWFNEYGGSDPGYQTLCTDFLADVHFVRPDFELIEPLKKSIKFLWFFAHPDGSFGGNYGSRNTRIYFPFGILSLAQIIPEAASLSAFMASSIRDKRVVTLSSIDTPNLVMAFNSYCWAAVIWHQNKQIKHKLPTLPSFSKKKSTYFFSDAGIFIDKGKEHYTIISTAKGGVVYHFVKDHKPLIDVGVVLVSKTGKHGSSCNDGDLVISANRRELQITSPITSMTKELPGPLQFLLLRLLAVSVFHSRFCREWFKKILVKKLISRKKKWGLENERKIKLGKQLEVRDTIQGNKSFKVIKGLNNFVSVHMASKGYWQLQDED